MEQDPDRRARTASGLSITPLAAIAVGFFLPSLRACGVMQRPVSYIAEHPATFPWLAAPYLAALILAVATTVCFVRASAPAARAHRAAWVAFGVSGLGSALSLMSWLSESRWKVSIVAWLAAVECVGLIAMQRAIRYESWRRWIRMIFVVTAFSAGNTVFVMIVTAMGDGAWDAVGIGGHLFVWSLVALALLAAYGVRPSIDAAPSQS